MSSATACSSCRSARDPGQPARNDNRTLRSGLSTFRSTRQMLCQVPSANRPPRTGTVAYGGTSAGITWERPCPRLPCRCCQRSSAGRRSPSAVRRSSSLPAPVSMIAIPAVACGTNTCSRPSPSSATNSWQRRVRSWIASSSPVRTLIVSLRKALLDPLHLGGELSVVPRPDIGLQHQADTWGGRGDDVHGLLDHRHHLVPLPLDVGEHGIGLAGEAGGAHDTDRLGDRLAHATTLVPIGRADAEGDEHGLSASAGFGGRTA